MADIKTITPSPQQGAFFDWIDRGTGNVVLEAVAGSGKSTTLAMGITLMRGSVCCMMFNKAAAKDFQKKCEEILDPETRGRTKVSTCHGIGYGAWTRFDPKAQLVERKVANIVEDIIARPETGQEDSQLLTVATNFIIRLISMGKSHLFGIGNIIPNEARWAKLVDYYGLENDLPEDGCDMQALYGWVTQVFNISGKLCKTEGDRLGIVDYDDMIWAPLAYNVRFYQNDWVLIDEAQDTNPARRELAKRILKRNGRLAAVGDSRQAIYGFTGADSDALQLIVNEFNAKRLPLTVSYRCPKAVVRHAHTWVSHIQAHHDAAEGEVRFVKLDPPVRKEGDPKPRPWFQSEGLTKNDAILCRFNKPLVETAFKLLTAGIACKMEGRDIGAGLIVLAKRWKVKTTDALIVKLEKFREREITKARAKKNEALEQSVNDRVDCVLVFIERCHAKGHRTVECVIAEILSLFADDVQGVLTLASGHKSKGREWDNVFWLVHKPRQTSREHESVQEDNLNYVITTRAKQRLVLVPEGTP